MLLNQVKAKKNLKNETKNFEINQQQSNENKEEKIAKARLKKTM